MPESIVQVTEGAGKKLHTFQRTVGANTVEDEVVAIADPWVASYLVAGGDSTIGASGQVLLQLMAGAALNVYVRRIFLVQTTLAGAAATFTGSIQRHTTAGTGGTAVTPALFDTSDGASGATAMRNPVTPGTLTTFLHPILFAITNAAPLRASQGGENSWWWEANAARGVKPIRIPAGITNGIAIRSNGAIATATIQVVIEFTEQSF